MVQSIYCILLLQRGVFTNGGGRQHGGLVSSSSSGRRQGCAVCRIDVRCCMGLAVVDEEARADQIGNGYTVMIFTDYATHPIRPIKRLSRPYAVASYPGRNLNGSVCVQMVRMPQPRLASSSAMPQRSLFTGNVSGCLPTGSDCEKNLFIISIKALSPLVASCRRKSMKPCACCG